MSGLDDRLDSDEYQSCAECGVAVDPLRAARVRLIAEQFHYFCSSRCADSFTPNDDAPPRASSKGPPKPPPAADLDVASGPPTGTVIQLRDALGEAAAKTQANTVTRAGKVPHGPGLSAVAAVEPTGAADAVRGLALQRPHRLEEPAAPQEKAVRQRAASNRTTKDLERWLGVTIALACLTIGLLLAKESALTDYLRATTLALGTAAYAVFSFVLEAREERRFSRLPAGLSLLALALALLGLFLMPEHWNDAASFAATSLAASAGTTLLLRRAFAPADAERRELRRWLDRPASRVHGETLETVEAATLRPGEEIVVHAGETVPADVTVAAGNAEIYPWREANTVHQVGPEDFVYAGARLASGQLRAVVRWTGADRHWERLTNDPTRRVDVHSPVVTLSQRLAFRGAPVLALIAVGAGPLFQGGPMHWALSALAAAGALLSPALHRLQALRAMQTVLRALGQGIVFRSADALDAAGRVSTAVFCARGTLLLGEPELSNIEPLAQSTTANEVLSLAAGAEQAQQHPAAVALMRAARARGVTPDAVRSPRHEQGLGVTAVAANGKSLVVGSRGLLLREQVSVARAEARITELEAMGRTVLLVALGNHLIGLLALQDGLRAGARAAVQHLLDAGIEPVLLSGDARKSCEALGRTIDIEHVRPEILPADRGREVERLTSGGAQVAVIGRSPIDEVALAAASLSVALPTPTTPNTDHDVELATEEVQKAALALRLAHNTRFNATRGLVILFGGTVGSVLAVVALSAPIAFVPIACFCFTLAAAALASGASEHRAS